MNRILSVFQQSKYKEILESTNLFWILFLGWITSWGLFSYIYKKDIYRESVRGALVTNRLPAVYTIMCIFFIILFQLLI